MTDSAHPAAQGAAAPASVSRTLWRMFAVAVLLALAWYLRSGVMLIFGAVLVATTLHALAQPLARHTPLSASVAVGVVLVALIALLGGAFWWLGAPLSDQIDALRGQLPKAWQMLQGWLQRQPFGDHLLNSLHEWRSGKLPWGNLATIATGVLHGFSSLLLILLMGAFLAFDVPLYRDGLVRLVPPRRRDAVGQALDAAGGALSRWLLGQLVTMVAVGVAVALGLSLIGTSLALALGLISGLLEFVPFFGPFASGGLAVLVAFAQGPEQALWTLGLFLLIQQLEGNLLVPLVQRWAVQLPPALGVGSVIVFASLFGLLGVVFGTPLIIVTMILVKKLYVEDALEKR